MPVRTALLSVAAGALVSNLFATQLVIAQIAAGLDIPIASAGLVPTLTMLGYACGLVFVLPLIDKLENRRLMLVTLASSVLTLAMAASAPGRLSLLTAAFLVGATSCGLQMIVVTAATQSSEAQRGRVIGSVMSGLMLGVLLSRPAGSLIAGALGWRAVYVVSAIAVVILTMLLARSLPVHRPQLPVGYFESLASLLPLVTREPVLRRRATYQALLMFSFTCFWTAVAWFLAQPPFNLGSRGIALFALAGAAGVIVAPAAGRAGDRGLTRSVTLWAHLAVIAGLALAALAARISLNLPVELSLLLLVAGAVLINLGGVADQALGRRAVNMIRPEARGRVNGLFTGSFFVGGALGAALAGPAWSAGGWMGVCGIAAVPAVLACALRLTERDCEQSRPIRPLHASTTLSPVACGGTHGLHNQG
jgi:predicted MFS family arabinose efflux permease